MSIRREDEQRLDPAGQTSDGDERLDGWVSHDPGRMLQRDEQQHAQHRACDLCRVVRDECPAIRRPVSSVGDDERWAHQSGGTTNACAVNMDGVDREERGVERGTGPPPRPIFTTVTISKSNLLCDCNVMRLRDQSRETSHVRLVLLLL